MSSGQDNNDLDYARRSFWTCARAGFSRLLDDAPAVWKDAREARYYREEKRMISAHTEPLKQGAMVTALLLFSFRVGGSKWFNRWRQKNNINLSASEADPASAATKKASPTTPPPRAQFKSYSEQQAEKIQHVYRDAGTWTTDLIVSIMCGLSSTILLTDKQKIAQDFVRAPLLPGKSMIYNDLCPTMTAAYESTNPAIWDDLSENEKTLQTFHNFVQNCRIRSEFLRTKESSGESVVNGAIQGQSDDIVPRPGLDGYPN